MPAAKADAPQPGTAPLRHYVEGRDANGRWFVASAHATRPDAEQAQADLLRSDPHLKARIVERPEGEETPQQDDTSEVEPGET